MFGYFENKANELWNIVAPEKTDGERLFIYVEEGRIKEVEDFLVNRSMDPNLKNPAGNTLIHVAAHAGRRDMVELLVKYGADARALGARMNSCLHFAAAKGHLHLVKYFVEEAKLKASQKNNLGQTAYDVGQGFEVKQYLMKLVLEEEANDGSMPHMLGITRDIKEDERRLQNLPPPPTAAASVPTQNSQMMQHNVIQSGGGNDSNIAASENSPPPVASSYQHRPQHKVSRPIKEDGFTTTVGNPELAAKYGNRITYRAVQETPPTSSSNAEPPKYSSQTHASPFSRGRYVTYNAKTNSGGKPVMPKTNISQPPKFQGGAKVFTPQPIQHPSQNKTITQVVQEAPPTGQSEMKSPEMKPHSPTRFGGPKAFTGVITPPNIRGSPKSHGTSAQGNFT